MNYRQNKQANSEHEQQQTVSPKEDQVQGQTAVSPQTSLTGDPNTLTQQTNGRLARAGDALLQLQNQQGNQHVQQVVNQAQTIQRKKLDEQDIVQQQPQPPNHTGLPDQLKHNLEQMSGLDMSDVQVHSNSSKPAEVGAAAFTQGSDIYLGSGQEKHLPHEAWHVAQQKQGRVQPTSHTEGVAINDDPKLEREADVMGERAKGIAHEKEVNQLESQTSTNVIQGRFLKLGFWDDEEISVSTEWLKANKETNGLATLTEEEWEDVDTFVELQRDEHIFAMNEQGKFDIKEVKKITQGLGIARKYAKILDRGDIVIISDTHGGKQQFEFPLMIANVAKKKGTGLIEAPVGGLDVIKEWGKTGGLQQTVADWGQDLADTGFGVTGVDALHPKGGGWIIGDLEYSKNADENEKYGPKDKPYPDDALGPGGKYGAMRQAFIAEHILEAVNKAQGGCIIVYGEKHLDKAGWTDYGGGNRRRIYQPSLAEHITGKKPKGEKIKYRKQSHLVQIIERSDILPAKKISWEILEKPKKKAKKSKRKKPAPKKPKQETDE